MVQRVKNAHRRCTSPGGQVRALHDAYLSVVEALAHAGTAKRRRCGDQVGGLRGNLTPENAAEPLGDVHGMMVPGGFGDRGIEGMITASLRPGE
jgi:CTP synthase